MGSEFLNIGVTGLLAYQQALKTTGHNISNVNTEGYSRQRVELGTQEYRFSGSGYVGNGVNVDTISRVFSQHAIDQSRIHTGLSNGYETYHDLSTQIDNLLADPDTGLVPAMSSFFGSVNDVASDPTSLAARETLLAATDGIASRFNQFGGELRNIDNQVDQVVTASVTTINDLAARIAELNTKIKASPSDHQPNDLLDERDRYLDQLAEQVSIQTIRQGDHDINVFIGNGQSLVVGNSVTALEATANQYQRGRLDVMVAGSNINITDSISGGKLGGTLEFRSQILDPTRAELDRLAAGIAFESNRIHRQGQDLQGNPGRDLFSDVTTVDALAGRNNRSATDYRFSSTIDDPDALSASGYLLRYSDPNGSGSGSYTLTRLTDNSEIFSGQIDSDFPLATGEGFVLTQQLGSAISNGDSWYINPASSASSKLESLVSDPKQLAIAAQFASRESSGNIGSGVISNGVMEEGDLYPGLNPGEQYQIIAANATSAATPAPPAITISGTLAVDDYGSATATPITLTDLANGGDPYTLTDSSGSSHDIGLAFSRTANPNEWQLNVTIADGTDSSGAAYTATIPLRFDSSGTLTQIDGRWPDDGVLTLPMFQPADIVDPTDPTGTTLITPDGTAIELNLAQISQQLAVDGNSATTPPLSAAITNATTPAAVSGYQLTINDTTVPNSAPYSSLEQLRDDINAANTGVTAYVNHGQLLLAESVPTGAPIRINEFGSSGNGYFSSGALDATNPQTTLINTTADSYVVVNPSGEAITSGGYAPGAEIRFDGLAFTLTGDLRGGDRFMVEANQGGVGDNRNALALAALEVEQRMEGGESSFQEVYAGLIGDVGSRVQQAEMQRDAEYVLRDQAIESRTNISGVNLDEEAANLMAFQQAYQANARVISVADTIFQTLLGAVGG